MKKRLIYWRTEDYDCIFSVADDFTVRYITDIRDDFIERMVQAYMGKDEDYSELPAVEQAKLAERYLKDVVEDDSSWDDDIQYDDLASECEQGIVLADIVKDM